MSPEFIAEKLIQILPRQLILGVQQRLLTAVDQARALAGGRHPGHRPHLEGQLRHGLLNEAIAEAFTECSIAHTPVKGCGLVVGSLGTARIGRLHVNAGPWINGTRSVSRQKLAQRNRAIQMQLQPDLLDPSSTVDPDITLFFVTKLGHRPEDTEVLIVVPDSALDMRNPLFNEPVGAFLQRYQQSVQTEDLAHPMLKPGVGKQGRESA